MTTTAPRCTEPGCPVRFRAGADRPCPMHTDDASDSMLGRMAAFEMLSAAPGERGEGETAADTEGDGPEGGTADTR